jgi:hypothetical protein
MNTKYLEIAKKLKDKVMPVTNGTIIIKDGYAYSTDMENVFAFPTYIEGTGAFEIKQILDVCKLHSNVQFSITDDAVMNITTGNMSIKIKGYKIEDAPMINLDTAHDELLGCIWINKNVKSLTQFLSKDILKYNLNFLHVVNNTIYATDAHYMGWLPLQTAALCELENVILSNKIELLPDEIYEVYESEDGYITLINKHHVMLRFKKFVYKDDKETKSFFNPGNFIPQEGFTQEFTVNRIHLINSLKSALPYACSATNRCIIQGYKLSTQDLDFSREITIDLKLNYKSGMEGSPLSFDIKKMLVIANNCKDDVLHFKILMANWGSPMVINGKYLLMQIAMSE